VGVDVGMGLKSKLLSFKVNLLTFRILNVGFPRGLGWHVALARAFGFSVWLSAKALE